MCVCRWWVGGLCVSRGGDVYSKVVETFEGVM